ncbi:MAG: molybdate ABC transporter substrate-binding protein [Burkholderiaceae bacterium]|nr:molybdate ABC transporter substrate-binding protein [Burkholderiaceae bacterium]
MSIVWGPRVKKALCMAAVLVLACASRAGEVRVAVAANFTAPMQRIAAAFEQDTGHRAVVAFGATGQLFAQISNGAPFDVLLSADQATAQRLEVNKLAVAGSRMTYATGQLALWSAQPGLINGSADILRTGQFDTIALANPKLAPYGVAAHEVLTHLGLTTALMPKMVEGASIGQTYQFVATGNATLGFVALSQVSHNGQVANGSVWVVPGPLHTPIAQDAVLLQRARANEAAMALMRYLRSPAARTIIQSFGYTV